MARCGARPGAGTEQEGLEEMAEGQELDVWLQDGEESKECCVCECARCQTKQSFFLYLTHMHTVPAIGIHP